MCWNATRCGGRRREAAGVGRRRAARGVLSRVWTSVLVIINGSLCAGNIAEGMNGHMHIYIRCRLQAATVRTSPACALHRAGRRPGSAVMSGISMSRGGSSYHERVSALGWARRAARLCTACETCVDSRAGKERRRTIRAPTRPCPCAPARSANLRGARSGEWCVPCFVACGTSEYAVHGARHSAVYTRCTRV